MRALEHGQFPLGPPFIEAQYIEIAVVAFDLEVAIVRPVPYIDVFGDLNSTPIQAEPLRHRFWMAGPGFDMDLQG